MSYYDAEGAHHEFISYGSYPQKQTVHIRWLIISVGLAVLLGISTIAGKTLAGVQQDEPSFASVQSAVAPDPNQGVITASAVSDEDVSEELQGRLEAWAAGKQSSWAFYVQSLDSNDITVGYHQEEQFDMASIYKLFLIRPLAQKIPSEAWGSSMITDKSYLSCVQAMLTVSDNPCAEAIAGRLGWSTAQRQIVADGYKQTIVNRTDKFVSSAADTGLLLDRLYHGDGYDAKTKTIAMEALGRSKRTEAIRKTCEGCTVYNKTGDIGSAKHDAAIVQKNGRSYVIVIFSKDASWPLMIEASRIITDSL